MGWNIFSNQTVHTDEWGQEIPHREYQVNSQSKTMIEDIRDTTRGDLRVEKALELIESRRNGRHHGGQVHIKYTPWASDGTFDPYDTMLSAAKKYGPAVGVFIEEDDDDEREWCCL